MKACYIDDKQCRVTLQILGELGVQYRYAPTDASREETVRELIAQLCPCPAVDEVVCLTSTVENRREHRTTADQCILVLDGEACFDVKDTADLWIRIHVCAGDLILLPAGLWQRRACPQGSELRARRFISSTNCTQTFRYEQTDHPKEGAPAYGWESLSGYDDPRTVIPEVCNNFYKLGWVSGTGGGMAVKHGNRYFMAASGVQKERLTEHMIFVLDSKGAILETPQSHPGQKQLKLSECAPLFTHAFSIRGAGACMHSHSLNVVLATLIDENADEFVVSHQEMIKGIAGHCFNKPLVIPIIENTPRECQLADLMAAAIKAYPDSPAVMVRRHGIYVWGNDWKHAKTQAECIDYLCEYALRMKQLGLDPAMNPYTNPDTKHKLHAWYMDPELSHQDQREPQKCVPNQPATKDQLEQLGVLQWRLDADIYETDPVLAEIRRERGYTYSDMITVSPEKLPGYEEKIKSFFAEHIHTDEEIRYILDGSGYFDVRDKEDKWIRIHMRKGDLITLPAGIYHRFTLDSRNYIKAMRLFVGEPVWTPYNRPQADGMAARAEYVRDFLGEQQRKKRSADAAALVSTQPSNGGVASKRTKQPSLNNGKKYEAILLDIEGTTTPISFVKSVLFPFAEKHVKPYLEQGWSNPEVQTDIQALRELASQDAREGRPGVVTIPQTGSREEIVRAAVSNVHWQIRNDRKTKALKQLQGHIWKGAYESGELKGQMFPDVADALDGWVKTGHRVFIYSSGSRQAQHLIFGYSEAGDLRKFLSGYFDTTVGVKTEPSSYAQIVDTIGVDPGSILFATDILKEADAATTAGLDAVLMTRPGNGDTPSRAPVPDGCYFQGTPPFRKEPWPVGVIGKVSCKPRKTRHFKNLGKALDVQLSRWPVCTALAAKLPRPPIHVKGTWLPG